MAALDTPRLVQKFQPWRNNTGNNTNSTSEGNTSQKISALSAATFSVSPVSRYNHMKASKDVTGKDASSAPSSELRRAISDTAAISSADINTLMRNWVMAQRTIA